MTGLRRQSMIRGRAKILFDDQGGVAGTTALVAVAVARPKIYALRCAA